MITMQDKIPSILLWLHKKAVYLPHLMAALSVLVSVGLFAIGRGDLFQYAGIVLIPLFIISVILIFNKNLKCNESAFSLPISQKILTKLYVIITSIAFIWIILGHQDLLQLILISISYLIILFQLFSKSFPPKTVLCEILITSALFILPQLFLSGYFYGDTDIISHSNYVDLIVSAGSLTEAGLGAYQSFCLSHIAAAIITLFSGVAGNPAYCILCAVAFLSSIPLVYLIATSFIHSQRIAVLSAFFYAVLPMTLASIVINPAPRMLATIAFFLILYLLFSLSKRATIPAIILTAVVTAFMCGVHHAQILLVFAVLALLVIGCLLYYRKITLGNTIAFSIVILLPICWQIYNYLATLTGIFTSRLLAMFSTGKITDTVISTDSTVHEISLASLFNNLPSAVLTILIFAALIFIITIIRHPKKISVLLPLLLLLFVAFVPMVLDSVPAISSAFQLYRFRLILTVFFAIAMAIGCAVLLSIPKKRHGKLISTILILGLCCILIISSVDVSSSKTNEVNIELGSVSDTYHFADGDMAMFSVLNNYGEDNTGIASNREYASYLARQINKQVYGFKNKFSSHPLLSAFTNNTDLTNVQYIIFPESRFLKIGLTIWAKKSEYVENTYIHIQPDDSSIYTYSHFRKNMDPYNTIYDNGEDIIYSR